LVRAVRPFLDGEEPRHVFVAQVGGNPAWALAALPLGFISLFIPWGTAASVSVAIVLSIAFVGWVFIVYMPMRSRLIAVTDDEIVVFKASKLWFNPKAVLRRLPRSHRFGPVEGFMTGKVDLGDGERGWVWKGYAGTIDVVDGRQRQAVERGLPPKRRLFQRRD
jgi:hypothetical protein